MAEFLRAGQYIERDVIKPGSGIPFIRAGTRLTGEVIERIFDLDLEDEVLACVGIPPSAGTKNDSELSEMEFLRLRELILAKRPGPPARRTGDPVPFLHSPEIDTLSDALAGRCLPQVVRELVIRFSRRLERGGTGRELRLRGFHALRHPINVLTLSVAMGRDLGYSADQLYSLAIAALLHESSSAALEQNPGLARLAGVPGVLETLRDLVAWQQGAALDIPIDRSFPKPAEILAVSDMYDTMVADRLRSRRVPVGFGYRIVLGMAGSRLNARAVEAFAAAVRPFPPGTAVTLTDRRRAIVSDLSPEDVTRPVVEVDGKLVDLVESSNIAIADVHVARREERTPVDLSVRLRLDDGEWLLASTKDISDHGVRIMVPGGVKPSFRAELDFSATSHWRVRSRAIVCWMRGDLDGSTFMGLYSPAGGLRQKAHGLGNCAS